jgi:hypothetical protein
MKHHLLQAEGLMFKNTHVTLILAHLAQEQAGRVAFDWRFNWWRLSDSQRISKYG